MGRDSERSLSHETLQLSSFHLVLRVQWPILGGRPHTGVPLPCKRATQCPALTSHHLKHLDPCLWLPCPSRGQRQQPPGCLRKGGRGPQGDGGEGAASHRWTDPGSLLSSESGGAWETKAQRKIKNLEAAKGLAGARGTRGRAAGLHSPHRLPKKLASISVGFFFFLIIKIIVFIIVHLGIAVKLTQKDDVCVSTIYSLLLCQARLWTHCEAIESCMVNSKKFLPVNVAHMYLPVKRCDVCVCLPILQQNKQINSVVESEARATGTGRVRSR